MVREHHSPGNNSSSSSTHQQQRASDSEARRLPPPPPPPPLIHRYPPPPPPPGVIMSSRSSSSCTRGRFTPAPPPHHHHLHSPGTPSSYHHYPYGESPPWMRPEYSTSYVSKYNLYSTSPSETSIKGGCTCKKSRCLKLYCQCFASSTTCGPNCKCDCCHNTTQHPDYIASARKSILNRNPTAFQEKVMQPPAATATTTTTTTTTAVTISRQGCKCRRSACLKKYCECFQNNSACGIHCQCVDCQNTVEHQQNEQMRKQQQQQQEEEEKSLLPERRGGLPYHHPIIYRNHHHHHPITELTSATSQKLHIREHEHEAVATASAYYRPKEVHPPTFSRQQQQQPLSTSMLPKHHYTEHTMEKKQAFTTYPKSSTRVQDTYLASTMRPQEKEAKMEQEEEEEKKEEAQQHDRMAIMAALAMTELGGHTGAPVATTETKMERQEASPTPMDEDSAETVEEEVVKNTTIPPMKTKPRRVSDLQEDFNERNDEEDEEANKKRKPEYKRSIPIKKRRPEEIEKDEHAHPEVISTSSTLSSIESRNPSPVATYKASPIIHHYPTHPHHHQSSRYHPDPYYHYHHHYPAPYPPPPPFHHLHSYASPPPTPYRASPSSARASPPPAYSETKYYPHHYPSPYRASPPTVSSKYPTFKNNHNNDNNKFEELTRKTGLPKSLSFRKICSKCGKTRGEHGELGFGNKCQFQDCGKCGAGYHWHELAHQPMGVLCQLTVQQGALPGRTKAYERKLQDLAARADLRKAISQQQEQEEEGKGNAKPVLS